jgi:bifunctional NMN adenylyltransferase/nudix hydrolase
MKHGVLIGRWQPLTNAHVKLIKACFKEVDALHIILGSAGKSGTPYNPFLTHTIEVLFKGTFPEEIQNGLDIWSDPEPKLGDGKKAILLHPIKDLFYNKQNWGAKVAYEVQKRGAELNEFTTLFGNSSKTRERYLDIFPYWSYKHVPSFGYGNTATDLRKSWFERTRTKEELFAKVPPATKELMGVYEDLEVFEKIKGEHKHYKKYKKKWDKAPFPPIFVTVDNIVIKSGHILLVERKMNPGKGLWAMPGGFADSEETLAFHAIEELKEETKIAMAKKELKKFQKLYPMPFDYVHRSARGRTITHVFTYNLGEGTLPKVQGGDDAKKAEWFCFEDLPSPGEMFEDHYEIIQKITSNL